jgi:ABC-2 type transport system permease protein
VSHGAYLRFELVRTFRNRRFLIFSLLFPVVLYFLIAGPNRHDNDLGGTGLSAPLYFMVGLTGFGTMNAVISCSVRIAAERSTGWNRQLRLTPLRPREYFRAKVLTSYVMALATIVVIYASGMILGVRMPAERWLQMTWLILIALIPLAALGVLFGHVMTIDSIGPAVGGTTALLAFLGGTWFPITGGGFLEALAKDLPSYWLVQAGHAGLGVPHPWNTHAWQVIVVWTVVLSLLAARAYRRDTERSS